MTPNASQVLLQPKYSGYSSEYIVNFAEKGVNTNQPFEIEIVVSGMSSMPLTVRFE